MSEGQLMSLLETTILPEMDFDHAHLSDAVRWLEGWWEDTHSSKTQRQILHVVILCKPPDDVGVNPFDTNPSHKGPHEGCNLRHVVITSTIKPSFRDALDAICKSAGVRWFIRDSVIYIDREWEIRPNQVPEDTARKLADPQR